MMTIENLSYDYGQLHIIYSSLSFKFLVLFNLWCNTKVIYKVYNTWFTTKMLMVIGENLINIATDHSLTAI